MKSIDRVKNGRHVYSDIDVSIVNAFIIYQEHESEGISFGDPNFFKMLPAKG